MRPTFRLTALVPLLALLGMSACVEGQTSTPGQPASAAASCVGKAARLVKIPRESIQVTQALSYPEGDVVTLAITGMGKVRCLVDVDGRTGDLVWIEGGPKAAPAS